MRFVIQRVTEASVSVDRQIIGSIKKGFVVLVGISPTDQQSTADIMVKKLLGMRIFEDSDGRTNLSLQDVEGSLLLVSQFTLYADCRKGNRPSFTQAGAPELAKHLYEYIMAKCQQEMSAWPSYTETRVQHGCFGAEMKVSLVNDGPFTILLDSEQLPCKS